MWLFLYLREESLTIVLTGYAISGTQVKLIKGVKMKKKARPKRIGVRVTAKEKAALEQLAIERDVPFSQVVREAVREFAKVETGTKVLK